MFWREWGWGGGGAQLEEALRILSLADGTGGERTC